jgi:hypothetical protein
MHIQPQKTTDLIAILLKLLGFVSAVTVDQFGKKRSNNSKKRCSIRRARSIHSSVGPIGAL